MSITHLPFPERYTPEQMALIAEHYADSRQQERDLKGWITVNDAERIHHRSSQQHFAVFGPVAYEVWAASLTDDGKTWEYLPALHEGRAYGVWPDEGNGGVAHLMRRVEPNPTGWMVTTLSLGWLRTKELEEPARVIAERLNAEAEDAFVRKTVWL